MLALYAYWKLPGFRSALEWLPVLGKPAMQQRPPNVALRPQGNLAITIPINVCTNLTTNAGYPSIMTCRRVWCGGYWRNDP